MPVYDFRCEECDAVFEVRASIKEKGAGLNPICLECHSPKVQQLISAGLLIRGSRESSWSFSACNPNAKGGCCR